MACAVGDDGVEGVVDSVDAAVCTLAELHGAYCGEHAWDLVGGDGGHRFAVHGRGGVLAEGQYTGGEHTERFGACLGRQ